MEDEGIVRSVPRPESTPRPTRWWCLAVAPPLTCALAWAADQALWALHAQAAGVRFWLSTPNVPVVDVHPSLVAWLCCASAGVAIAVRLVAAERRVLSLLLAIALVAPLGFGTVRDAVRWLVAPRVTRTITLVPACIDRGPGPSDAEQDGTRFRFDGQPGLDLTSAKVRWDDSDGPNLVLHVGPPFEDLLTRRSDEGMRLRLGGGSPCGFDVFLVDGRTRAVASYQVTLRGGGMALTDPDPARLRALFSDLTTP